MKLLLPVLFCVLASAGAGSATTAGTDQGLRFTQVVAAGDALPGAPAGSRFHGVYDPQLGGPEGDLVAFYGEGIDHGFLQGFYVAKVGGPVWRVFDSELVPTLPGAPPGMSLGGTGFLSWEVDETGLFATGIECETGTLELYYAVLGWRDGTFFPIAWPGQPIPGDPDGATFWGALPVAVSGGAVYFFAERNVAEPELEYYRWIDGAIDRLDLGALELVQRVTAGLGGLVFDAADDNAMVTPFGIWRWRAGLGTDRIFDYNSPFPGVPGATWRTLDTHLSVLDDAAVIMARPSTGGTAGLFRVFQDQHEVVLWDGDIDPVTGLVVRFTTELSGSGDRIAFGVRNSGDFLGRIRLQDSDRSIRKILDPGDVLAGQTVGTFIDLSGQALRGDRLVLGASLSGTGTVVLLVEIDPEGDPPTTAEIPTLGTVGAAALVLLLAIAGAGILRAQSPIHPYGIGGSRPSSRA